MKKSGIALALAVVLMAMTGCGGGSSSTPLGKLCDVYAQIAENKQDIADAVQAAYKAPKEQQQALMEKANLDGQQKNALNKELGKKAEELGAALQGTEIPVEVDPALGYKVEKMTFAVVEAQENFANIVLKGAAVGSVPGRAYVLMLNKNGEVVTKTLASLSENALTVNFLISTTKGPEVAREYADVVSLKVVTEAEYKTGVAPTESANAEAAPEEAVEPETVEPEAAFTGDDNASAAGSLTVNGIEIKKGDPIAATLRKFNNVTWEYNADFGVIAHVGNVWIVIDEADDLTPQGKEFMSGIYSDIEPDLKFSVDYIKPTAKISQVNKD